MNKDDLHQAHQVGGLKTQNKFMREDIADLRGSVLLLGISIIILGVAILTGLL